MSRINLLTMHYDDNNGAFLQTYATCELLRRLGHEVTIINMVDPVWHRDRFRCKYNYKLLLRYLRFELCRRRYLPKRTRLMYSPDPALIPEADYTVVGSDQVWNRSITGFSYLSYFLDFLPDGAKRFSLASSFGTASIQSEKAELKRIGECLSRFSGISTRERSGAAIIRDSFGLDAVTLPDPTIALSDFDALLPKRFRRRGYVGLFTFRRDGYSLSVAGKVAGALGRRLIWVNAPAFARSTAAYAVGHQEFQSPKEWLAYIRNADFFLSDSFHGVVFCLLFHTPFFALCADEAKFERIESLLDTFGLKDRIVRCEEELEGKMETIRRDIDWKAVDDTTARQKEDFLSFVGSNIRRTDDPPVYVWGVKYNLVTAEDIVRYVDRRLSAGDRGIHLTGVNAETIMLARKDEMLRRAIMESDIVNVDSFLPSFFLKAAGYGIKDRVPTPEVMDGLLENASQRHRSVYFLGSKQSTLDILVPQIQKTYPGIVIAGSRNGYFTGEELPALIDAISSAAPDYLFIALPSPLKERIILDYKEVLGAGCMYGVGGAFEAKAGVLPRPPGWASGHGLEGIFRLVRNPKRYGRRFLNPLRFMFWGPFHMK